MEGCRDGKMEGPREGETEGLRGGETEGWSDGGPERCDDGGQPGTWTTAEASAGLEQSHHLYRENYPEQAHCQLGTVVPSVLLTGAFLEGYGECLCRAKLLLDVSGEG